MKKFYGTIEDGILDGKSDTSTTTEKTSSTGSSILPVGTTAQRDLVPFAGLMRYNTDLLGFEGYVNGAWGSIGGSGGAKGTGTDAVFYENDQTVTASYTITAGQNAMSAGTITIADGVTVTIPDGSTWSIV